MFYYYVLNVLRWFADCYARCDLLDQLSQVKTRSDKQNATFISSTAVAVAVVHL